MMTNRLLTIPHQLATQLALLLVLATTIVVLATTGAASSIAELFEGQSILGNGHWYD